MLGVWLNYSLCAVFKIEISANDHIMIRNPVPKHPRLVANHPRLSVKVYLSASPCWAKSGGPRLHHRLSALLLLIDRNSGSEDQLLSHQHFAGSRDTWQGRRTTSARKGKKNKCAQQARHKISCDKADQCKAGGERPAAVCKLIIVLSGPVSLT